MSDLTILVNRCLRGEQAAMSQLVDRFKGQVFGLCFRMLGHRQDAEDVAQETFVRVLKNLHRWDQDRDFEPWLLTIAGNRCRTALASRQRRPIPQPFVDPVTNRFADHRRAANLAEEIQRGLERLRPEYREAFVLFHEHQLSYDQIAAYLSRPMGTVKTWIHRARLELIQCLREREAFEETGHAVH